MMIGVLFRFFVLNQRKDQLSSNSITTAGMAPKSSAKIHRFFQSSWFTLLCAVMAFGGMNFIAEANISVRFTPLATSGSGESDSGNEAEAEVRVGFRRISSVQSGVNFVNRLSDVLMIRNINLLNGSGLALGDFDRDGLVDIYFSGLQSPSALYRNLGSWRFEDVTSKAGVANPRSLSTGAAFVDVNADGWLDLMTSAMGGPNALFINQRDGTFSDSGQASGVQSSLGATSMAFADVDQDGDLDYYQCYYGVTSILKNGGALNIIYRNGQPVVRGRHADRIRFVDGFMMELGEPDQLMLNDGTGRFSPVSWTEGRFLDSDGRPIQEAPWDQGLSVRFTDFNQDGFPDIYVCNDGFTPDRIWMNRGRGVFQEPDPFSIRKSSYFSMGMDVADIDLDQQDDFLVVDMLSRDRRLFITQQSMTPTQGRKNGVDPNRPQSRRNMLYRNRGDGSYAETAWFSGVAGSEWSWSPIFIDVDLDGYKDLLVSNGFPHDVDDKDVQEKIQSLGKLPIRESQKTLLLFPPLATPNKAFRNQGDGTFQELGGSWGFDSVSIGNGMVSGDLDGDGDLDLAINCFNSNVEIYENLASAPRVTVRLSQPGSLNPDAVGSRIELVIGSYTQAQEIIAGGRYMSGEIGAQTFAFPSKWQIETEAETDQAAIVVRWPDGEISRHEGIRPGLAYHITKEGKGTRSSPRSHSPGAEAESQTWFESVDSWIPFEHQETPFDDFGIQPMLSGRRSQDGPGVALFDWNQDGNDDAWIPNGSGGSPGVFLGRLNQEMIPVNLQGDSFSYDVLSVCPWPQTTDSTQIIFTLDSSQTQAQTSSPLRNTAKSGGQNTDLQQMLGSFSKEHGLTLPESGGMPAGVLAAGDWNGDGALDLFVGGRPVLKQYPLYSESKIFLSHGANGGSWMSWSKIGPTSSAIQNLRPKGAVFTDIDQDRRPELIVAEDWGGIRVFSWNEGLKEITSLVGLESATGLWTGIASGDLDGDGDMDLVAGNLGWNTRRERVGEDEELQLYYGDDNRNGIFENFEVYLDDGDGKYYPFENLSELLKSLPTWKNRFSSHAVYALTPADKIFDPQKTKSYKRLSIRTLDVSVFWNDSGRFVREALPARAQWAPVFGVTLADWDGDGDLDLFLAQNFFGTPESEAGHDAGTGLILSNLGNRKWKTLSPGESGVLMYGEQRGSSTADLNADGRPDLVVAQNAADLKVYINRAGVPGLRVKLPSATGNEWGVGIRARLKFKRGYGLAQEALFGSGYGSQNSGYLIFHQPAMLDQKPITGLGEIEGLELEYPEGSRKLIPINETEWARRVGAGKVWRLGNATD